jgi:ABC-type multidrug transport system ATPase subunit
MKYYQKILRLFRRNPIYSNNEFELQESESQEVIQESQYVSQLVKSGNFYSEALIVDKLAKKFKNSVLMPNKLSFTVHKEECFGLLGINGSGKTTTFRLLTGDLSPSSGNAYLDSNTNLFKNRTQFYSHIGYCPQTDALLDRLTGMQTLKLFGRLRGLESNAFKSSIKNIIEKFELKNIINNKLLTYSGGNRRKLSLAIALIGNPSLLLLDEPTNGVDPDSRLRIWQLLRDLLINCKTSILLTSHNMEECEALCSRLAIMSNGVLKTIGFISDIKKIYAKGFTLILKVNLNCDESNVEELKSKVYETFGDNCILKYENFGVIYYHLNPENIKLSQIFHTLDTLKTEFQLEDYYVSNASLEQAFLSIIGETNQ